MVLVRSTAAAVVILAAAVSAEECNVHRYRRTAFKPGSVPEVDFEVKSPGIVTEYTAYIDAPGEATVTPWEFTFPTLDDALEELYHKDEFVANKITIKFAAGTHTFSSTGVIDLSRLPISLTARSDASTPIVVIEGTGNTGTTIAPKSSSMKAPVFRITGAPVRGYAHIRNLDFEGAGYNLGTALVIEGGADAVVEDITATKAFMCLAVGTGRGRAETHVSLKSSTAKTCGGSGLLVTGAGVLEIQEGVVAEGYVNGGTSYGAGVQVRSGGKVFLTGDVDVKKGKYGVVVESGGEFHMGTEELDALTIAEFSAAGLRVTSGGAFYSTDDTVTVGAVKVTGSDAAQHCAEVRTNGLIYGSGFEISGQCKGVVAAANGACQLQRYKDVTTNTGDASVTTTGRSVCELSRFCIGPGKEKVDAGARTVLTADAATTAGADVINC